MGWSRLIRVKPSVEHGMASGRSGRTRSFFFDGLQDGPVGQAFGVFELCLVDVCEVPVWLRQPFVCLT